MQANRQRIAASAAALILALSSAGGAIAHDQHGPGTDHLAGTGAWGSIDLVSTLELTQTPGLVADVAVNPAGTYAFLANWGEPDCAGPETGGQTSPDAGAWVVDIRDLENPELVTFIPSSQDTRPGEGMQVVNITTKWFTGDMLVMNNEHCGKNGKGGVSLYDVTDPERPKRLSEHFGDRANLSSGDANDIHSAFAWDAGDRAYVVIVDNFENADVDILDITNPSRPRLVKELQLDALYTGTTQTALGLVTVNLHDVVVKQIGGHWVLLASYWDGGYIQLNVDDPANPTLIGDTDYSNPDPELLESTGVSRPPEGNGHQAEFTADNQYFIATDEDFSPYGATSFSIADGPYAGAYPSVPVPGAAPIVTLDDELLNGPTVYGGYGCPDSAPIPSPSSIAGYEASLLPGEEKIIVLQRGPTGDPSATEAACFPGEKAHQAVLAGWDAVLFVQRHGGTENPPFCGSGAFVDEIVGVCTNHEAYHKLFNTAVSTTYPDGPAIGTVGAKISATAAFDGWGYVHLYSNTPDSNKKFAELDTYAIDEAHDEAFAVGFGDLTVHEVATHPTDATRSYLSYYAGGLRALQIVGTELVEVGGYLDEDGNNFWGVEVFVRDGTTYILGSDRDSGLWIFRDSDA
ncbi:MAG TPA: hypothetical protein VFK54_09150 [Candidatus Limnocylindrales bacterium]|nr:hypothetical protein [Candidatus Limnocylindrales bacterium]